MEIGSSGGRCSGARGSRNANRPALNRVRTDEEIRKWIPVGLSAAV
jgi:hypothetical protein